MKKMVMILIGLLLTANITYADSEKQSRKPKIRIKIATLATSGSYDGLKQAVLENTDYEVGLKFYYGGIQGDAKDVLRKIRFKQLHGATLSGYGLGQIVPESRVTNIPYVFKNYGEVKYVRDKLESTINQKFENKGYKVLGWHNIGFIYTFSKVPITSIEVAREQKFWVPENDEVANVLCETLGISPVSLSITDVMTSLSTRLIDAASAPPLAAVAFRWYTRFDYMTEFPLGNVMSALIITMPEWNKISPKGQKGFQEAATRFFEKAEGVLRERNRKSIDLLKKAGIKVVRLNSDEEKAFIQTTSKKTMEALVGKMFSRELLDTTLGYLQEYRQVHPESGVERID